MALVRPVFPGHDVARMRFAPPFRRVCSEARHEQRLGIRPQHLETGIFGGAPICGLAWRWPRHPDWKTHEIDTSASGHFDLRLERAWRPAQENKRIPGS